MTSQERERIWYDILSLQKAIHHEKNRRNRATDCNTYSECTVNILQLEHEVRRLKRRLKRRLITRQRSQFD